MTSTTALEARIAELEHELATYRDQETTTTANLARFDEMDFEAFSTENWDLFRQLHTENPHVVMPDGSVVAHIDPHTDDMKAMFAYLPDLRVAEHPHKVAQGDWTAVVGRFTGTFTQPMVLPDGTQIPPTGNTVNLMMATFARWENNAIAEEILFWDSGEFMRQLGVQ